MLKVDTTTNNRTRLSSSSSSEPLSPMPELNLSPAMVASVQAAWKNAIGKTEDMNSPGLASFRQIFMQMDEIRLFFGFVGLEDPLFIKHTGTFSRYLDKLIMSLQDMNEFDKKCDKLGRIHVHVRSADFRPSYWDCFATSIISCALDEPNFPVQQAWRQVILYMIARTKAAYQDEKYGLQKAAKKEASS